MAFQIFLVLFLVLNALQTFNAAAEEDDLDPDTRWENFKKTYQKAYSAEEEETKRKNFEENYRIISEHNQKYDQGMHSFSLGLNEYSDMLNEEFSSSMNRMKSGGETAAPIPFVLPDCPVPDAVDWRNESAVTPVKKQGYKCGSCYAFTSTGALEGQHKLRRGKLVSLSEQNLIDCSQPEGNLGCNGGFTDASFRYVMKNGGIDSEKSYPYTEMVGQCKYRRKYSASQCMGYSDLPSGNETILQIVVACIGPIPVAIDANHTSFQHYKGGIYYNPNCSSTNYNHGVLVIGYGSEDGEDYWLLKNSYGTTWGMEGYMKMARNLGNLCGIATKASYPIL